MKLVPKLTLVLLTGSLLVRIVHAQVRVAREVRLFEDDFRQDHHTIGIFLSTAVLETWRSQGRGAAQRIIDTADAREADSQLRVRWIPPDARFGEEAGPVADVEPAARARVTAVEVPLGDRGTHLISYVPVSAGDPSFGSIELAESVAGRDEYIRQTLINYGVSTVLLFVLYAILAAAANVWIVGRPMRALAARARRIGEGHLSERISLKQDDEIGELAREMNAMCAELEAAREALAQQTAARIAAMEQLRHTDRLATVGKLASGLAHEMGTPLNVVSGRAKMIAAGEAVGEEAAECARIVVAQADRITKIIRQLLDFSRRRGPQRARIDVQSIARQTIELLVPLARRHDVSLLLEGDEHVTADVDAGQIQQALTNLIVNAVQAMTAPGKVTVRLGRERVRPPPDIGGPEAEHARIDVHDTGRGITAADLPRIFEPFFTTKQVGEGTGLGLSVAFGLVREHGGWIAVESEVQRGSVFSIYLPMEART